MWIPAQRPCPEFPMAAHLLYTFHSFIRPSSMGPGFLLLVSFNSLHDTYCDVQESMLHSLLGAYPMAYCMYNSFTLRPNISECLPLIDDWAERGWIDSTDNLKGFKAFLYLGLKDGIISPSRSHPFPLLF